MLPSACMAQNHPAVSRAAPGSCRAWGTQQHSPHRGSCQQCHPIASAPKAASPPTPQSRLSSPGVLPELEGEHEVCDGRDTPDGQQLSPTAAVGLWGSSQVGQQLTLMMQATTALKDTISIKKINS